jgi:hypothetical protein
VAGGGGGGVPPADEESDKLEDAFCLMRVRTPPIPEEEAYAERMQKTFESWIRTQNLAKLNEWFDTDFFQWIEEMGKKGISSSLYMLERMCQEALEKLIKSPLSDSQTVQHLGFIDKVFEDKWRGSEDNPFDEPDTSSECAQMFDNPIGLAVFHGKFHTAKALAALSKKLFRRPVDFAPLIQETLQETNPRLLGEKLLFIGDTLWPAFQQNKKEMASQLLALLPSREKTLGAFFLGRADRTPEEILGEIITYFTGDNPERDALVQEATKRKPPSAIAPL